MQKMMGTKTKVWEKKIYKWSCFIRKHRSINVMKLLSFTIMTFVFRK